MDTDFKIKRKKSINLYKQVPAISLFRLCSIKKQNIAQLSCNPSLHRLLKTFYIKSAHLEKAL